MEQRPVLRVNQVWKKYCRNLKRSMWYGLRDLAKHTLGIHRPQPLRDALRPGEFYAVREADFELPEGQCIGLIGPNGAGKSTMLKMINGLIRPDSGSISIRGRTGALIELGTGFNPILSGRENVYINGAVLGMKKRDVDHLFDDIVGFAELEHVIDDPIRTYSSGMRIRLGYAVAAHLRPQLLIMDEVLAVGDVGFRMKCFQHLRTLVQQGVSIILVTHAVGLLPRVATRVILFEKGRITFDGDVQPGIARYEECLAVRNQQSPAVVSTSELNHPRLVAAQTLNAAGLPQRDFQTGDSLRLRLTIESPGQLTDQRLIVNLGTANTDTVASISNAYLNRTIEWQPGQNQIELTIEKLPFLVGGFAFDISLYGPQLDDFHERRMGQGAFRIIGPSIDTSGYGICGLVALPHHWD